MKNRIVHADNFNYLLCEDAGSVDFIYIDPPFNTGKWQERKRTQTLSPGVVVDYGSSKWDDRHDDYLGFLSARLVEARRVLKHSGSLFFHIDYREAHYCKVLLDTIFGRESFINEIIWAYDYGARSKSRWPCKHDTLFWYAKNPDDYTFNYDEMDRIPYMAPGLAGPEKAAKGKTPTDVWWHTIVSPNGREKTGYATQKPLGVLTRILKVHTNPGDHVLDFFAGSGTTGEAAGELNRAFTLVDKNPEAIEVMRARLERFNPTIT